MRKVTVFGVEYCSMAEASNALGIKNTVITNYLTKRGFVPTKMSDSDLTREIENYLNNHSRSFKRAVITVQEPVVETVCPVNIPADVALCNFRLMSLNEASEEVHQIELESLGAVEMYGLKFESVFHLADAASVSPLELIYVKFHSGEDWDKVVQLCKKSFRLHKVDRMVPVCDDCGEMISDVFLELHPNAHYCVKCFDKHVGE